jgi:uncharacterized protein YndB with AHSA1/START domain
MMIAEEYVALDSYHEADGSRFEHDVGSLRTAPPPHRFVFRWVDDDAWHTNEVITRQDNGSWHVEFTYREDPDMRDIALAIVRKEGPDTWEIRVNGLYRGEAYVQKIYATRK